MSRLLLVEDENLLRWALRTRLMRAGHTVDEAPTLAAAEEILRRTRPEVVLLDVNLPDGNGLDFLAAQREKLAESIVLVFTADGRVEDAVRAMKLGALDFLAKPVDQEELIRVVGQATALHHDRLEAEGSRRAREKQTSVRVIAESPAMERVLSLALTVATSSSTTVLVQGETGVGKEVVARYIHANSPRVSAPLQALNCAAIPENLVESELFGYEKGAFTDAKTSRKGLFELADSGTVVLDEIGELPPLLQSKLLRFLEERSFRRLGGVREIAVDVRILALTNRSLEQQVVEGKFREDLFFRLNVFPITVPPLRERREDILPLALSFIRQFGAASGKRFTAIAPELEARLVAHDWTGNVRELRNLMERAAIMENGEILTGESLTLSHAKSLSAPSPLDNAIIPLDEVEFTMVERAFRASKGNQSQAARLLKVSRDQLRYRVKRYRELGTWPADLGADEA
jgi:two-component system response regulator AtoC